MKEYHNLVREVLFDEDGIMNPSEKRRNGYVISGFNYNYEIDLRDGFPLLTTKKMSWKNIVVETLWYISGSSSNTFLKRHGVNIWDKWTDHKGEVETPYGAYWRAFGNPHTSHTIDQVEFVLETLLINPMSRRMVVTSWNPPIHTSDTLPPCHVMWVLQATRSGYEGRSLNLHLTQRSGDVAVGVPYNIACYALLLSILARVAGMKPWKLAHSIVQPHIYADVREGKVDHRPGLGIQLSRNPRKKPKLCIDESIKSLSDIEQIIKHADTESLMGMFKLKGYNPHTFIKFDVAP